ncbi:MAG: transcription termination/antitermination NusG family protein [Rikenellaceae bacterium]
MNDLDTIDWFVLKVRFQRASMAQKRLHKPDIEVYLPMEVRSVPTKCGGQRVKPMPIFSDMIFLKTSFRRVSEICAAYKDMYYKSEVINGLRRAIRIPEDQMTTFREFIAGNYDNIDCKMTKLKSGQKIVVKSGMFKGSKIVFKEEKGNTKKEYQIEINGIDWSFSEESLSENLLSRI